MKSVSESMKEVETKKSHLQEQVDQLNEDCARLKAQGKTASCVGCLFAPCYASSIHNSKRKALVSLYVYVCLSYLSCHIYY